MSLDKFKQILADNPYFVYFLKKSYKQKQKFH